ncbi:MAG: heavy metal-associated domain-containing protein [Bryobacteraceae bacterium]
MIIAPDRVMRIQIEGMHCDACVMRVRKFLMKLPEVKVNDVSIGAAEVEIPPERRNEVLLAIEKAGYLPHIPA